MTPSKNKTSIKLSTRIIASSAALLLIMLTSFAVISSHLLVIKGEYATVADEVMPRTLDIFEIQVLMTKMREEFVNAILLSGHGVDNSAQYYNEAKAAIATLASAPTHVDGVASPDASMDSLQAGLDSFYAKNLTSKVDAFYLLGQEMLAKYSAGDTAGGEVLFGKFNAASQEFRALTKILTKQQKAVIDGKNSTMKASIAFLDGLIVKLSLLSGLIFLAVGWYFHTKLKKDFGIFNAFFHRAAHEHARIESDEPLIAEFSVLADYANHMIDAIHEHIKLLKEYKKAIDSAAIVSKVSPDNKITYVNDKFCEIFGWSQEELIGGSHEVIHNPNMPQCIRDGVWEKLRHNQIWQGELSNIAKSGELILTIATVVPIMNHRNELVETISIRTDITEQKQMEQEFRTLREQKVFASKDFDF